MDESASREKSAKIFLHDRRLGVLALFVPSFLAQLLTLLQQSSPRDRDTLAAQIHGSFATTAPTSIGTRIAIKKHGRVVVLEVVVFVRPHNKQANARIQESVVGGESMMNALLGFNQTERMEPS